MADGYDPDAMDEMEQAAAGDTGGVKQNALATLVNAGARVTPMAASQSADAMAKGRWHGKQKPGADLR